MCPAAFAAGLEEWIGERIAAFSVPLEIVPAPAEPSALQRQITELDCRLLAIEAGTVDGLGDRLRKFAEGFACELLIVR